MIQPESEKPVIMFIARQHSGETFSSFIIHGLINSLISQGSPFADLREQLEFWIVPMVNIDGVVLGNYRTNCQGRDMNRSFFPIDEYVSMTSLS